MVWKTAAAISSFQVYVHLPVSGRPSHERLDYIRGLYEEDARELTIMSVMSEFEADYSRTPTEIEVGILYQLHQHLDAALEAQFGKEAREAKILADKADKFIPNE